MQEIFLLSHYYGQYMVEMDLLPVISIYEDKTSEPDIVKGASL